MQSPFNPKSSNKTLEFRPIQWKPPIAANNHHHSNIFKKIDTIRQSYSLLKCRNNRNFKQMKQQQLFSPNNRPKELSRKSSMTPFSSSRTFQSQCKFVRSNPRDFYIRIDINDKREEREIE